jgi:hypothetical protein
MKPTFSGDALQLERVTRVGKINEQTAAGKVQPSGLMKAAVVKVLSPATIILKPGE